MHDQFFLALFEALNDEGILVLQLGVAPYTDEPPDSMMKDYKRDYLSKSLERVGFESIHLYEEAHCDFRGKVDLYFMSWNILCRYSTVVDNHDHFRPLDVSCGNER